MLFGNNKKLCLILIRKVSTCFFRQIPSSDTTIYVKEMNKKKIQKTPGEIFAKTLYFQIYVSLTKFGEIKIKFKVITQKYNILKHLIFY